MKVYDQFEQGSAKWLDLKRGKVTASIIGRLKGGKTRQSEIYKLAGETLTGKPAPSFVSEDMRRGIFLEEPALQAFAEDTGHDLYTVAFVEAGDPRIGCSPDALIGDDAGVEVKCPRATQHLNVIHGDGKLDYYPQIQFSLWVTGRKEWHLVSFCPWVEDRPLYHIPVYRDEDMIAELAERATKAADEIEKIVKSTKAEVSGEVAKIAKWAAEAWEAQ